MVVIINLLPLMGLLSVYFNLRHRHAALTYMPELALFVVGFMAIMCTYYVLFLQNLKQSTLSGRLPDPELTIAINSGFLAYKMYLFSLVLVYGLLVAMTIIH
jgi:hypothetical protein